MTSGIKNKKNKIVVLISTLLIASQSSAGGYTQEPLSMQEKMKHNRVPLGNINGSTGNVFKEGMFRVVLKDTYFEADTAYSGDDEVPDMKKRKLKVNVAQLVARYGLGKGFDVRMMIPILNKKLGMTNPMNGKSSEWSSDGIGDIAIIGRYALMNQMKGDPLFFSIGAGVKLATGSTDETFKTPMGMKIIPGMQNGSGSTDYILEAGVSKILPNSRIDASIAYKINGDGDNDYDFGNMLRWNIGYSYAMTRSLDLQLELDGIHRDKNSFKGNEIDSTGGDTIYLTPGFHYRVTKQFDVSVGYAIPVWRDINYDAGTRTGGLSEDGRLIVRVGYTF
jgi:hypothetical protein